MKVLLQVNIMTVVEITELPGLAAKVEMPTPKLAVNVFIFDPKNGTVPEGQDAIDLQTIAVSHVAGWLHRSCQERLEQIGEAVPTQVGGNA